MQPSHASSHRQADLLLVAVTLLAAAGWIFSRETVAGLSPLVFMALRFTSAGIILALLDYRALHQLDRSQWQAALRIGLLFGIAMIFWVTGLKLTTHVGIGAFLTCLGLVFVPVISLLFGDRPSLHVYFALPLALAGLACLSLDSDFHLGVAEACFLMATFILALMFILSSRAAARIPAMPLTAIQMLVTGLLTAIASLIFEDWDLQQPPAIWGWFFASLLISTCLRYLWQTRALGMTLPSHSAIIMILEPVWTAILAALWLNEQMSALQLGGCGLIFISMLVNRWPALRLWLKAMQQTPP
ncbi:MAG: DMT family transporter [Spongiibacteraceae bacterium]